MARFIGRQREMEELDEVLEQEGGKFLLVYGRRQVGKTTLVLHWAQESGRPLIYWVANRNTPTQLRYSMSQTVWTWAHPGSRAIPRFQTWTEIFETLADLVGERPVTIVFDQYSYAVESDATITSDLQSAWDRLFKDRDITLALVGSHIGLMVDLMDYDAPLYGRITTQLPVDPLAFPFLTKFLPNYTPEERVAVYAVTGGIPAYLEKFSDEESVGENVQRLFMQRTSQFRSEPFVIIGEVIRRETKTYEAVLNAIATGKRTPQEIGTALGMASSHFAPYLRRLRELRLIERRVPATVPLEDWEEGRISEYVVADPYLHFYFRFIAPNLRLVEQNLASALWKRIQKDFTAFVGESAFQQLCRDWVMLQAGEGNFPFLPEVVGLHWDHDTRIDLVATNWEEKAILFGECIWGASEIDPLVVADLVEKGKRVVPGSGWQVHHAVFSRVGFSEATRALAAEQGVRLVDLATMDADLRAAYLSAEEEEEEEQAKAREAGEERADEGPAEGEAEEGQSGEEEAE